MEMVKHEQVPLEDPETRVKPSNKPRILIHSTLNTLFMILLTVSMIAYIAIAPSRIGQMQGQGVAGEAAKVISGSNTEAIRNYESNLSSTTSDCQEGSGNLCRNETAKNSDQIEEVNGEDALVNREKEKTAEEEKENQSQNFTDSTDPKKKSGAIQPTSSDLQTHFTSSTPDGDGEEKMYDFELTQCKEERVRKRVKMCEDLHHQEGIIHRIVSQFSVNDRGLLSVVMCCNVSISYRN